MLEDKLEVLSEDKLEVMSEDKLEVAVRRQVRSDVGR